MLVALSLSLAARLASAQASATLRGHVTDPTGAMIPGAQITVTTVHGSLAGKATADAAGGYAVHGLAPGSYVVQVDSPGFAAYVSVPISLEAGQVKTFTVKMTVEAAKQQVEVSADSDTVSTEAGANTSAIVLKGNDLNALSDDPDELENELEALAGPAAGPNGGQIYIDGFTGGTLPPKSAIREIRINQNPYSAEYDRLGFGRIEILTKPGTDTLHGRFFTMGNDDVFNTGNPFTTQIPAYYSIQGNATVSGSMSKSSSYFFTFEERNSSDASIYSAQTAALSGGIYVPTLISGGLYAPDTRISVSPRFDFQLGAKNTLTFRYQFNRSTSSGSIGSDALPEQNASSIENEHTLQLSDSIILNDHLVNEIRFEYRRANSTETPTSTAPTVTVPDYFMSGGASTQASSTHSDHFELQNYISLSHGAQAIKFGTWLRDNREAVSSDSNFNGSFTFPSRDAYIDTLNGMLNGETVAQIAAACTDSSGCTPSKLQYTTGPLSYAGNLFDAALFFQDDWKVNRFLTLSGGLRWESQNHIADHSDFAPRVAFAYALDGHKTGKSKTVLRGGYGLFYDRFQLADLLNLEQYSGTSASQVQTVISNPTCFSATSLGDALAQGCSSSSVAPSTPVKYTVSPNYRSPYATPIGLSLERQVAKSTTLSFTYLHYFGVHQLVTRDANAYLPGSLAYSFTDNTVTVTGTRPTSYAGIIDQYFPEAVFKQNQFMVNLSARLSARLSINGYFNYTNAKSDGGGGSNPSNSWNLSQDYGRASFIIPRQVFLMANYAGPWGISFNPFLIAESGKPYNITSTFDLTGDNYFNSRPSYASSATLANSTLASYVAQTSFGALNTVPQSGETLLPVNFATGPAAVAFNLRMSRSIGIGPSAESSAPPPRGFGGPGGGPHGGGGHGGGFGGGNPFSSGPPRGGMNGTGRKYSLNFSVQALNLFNNIDYGTPSGTVVPTLDSSTGIYGPGSRFGKSTDLAGGMFASRTGSAARRIFVQMAFQF